MSFGDLSGFPGLASLHEAKDKLTEFRERTEDGMGYREKVEAQAMLAVIAATAEDLFRSLGIPEDPARRIDSLPRKSLREIAGKAKMDALKAAILAHAKEAACDLGSYVSLSTLVNFLSHGPLKKMGPGHNFLELGCGVGVASSFVSSVSGATCFAVDSDSRKIEVGKVSEGETNAGAGIYMFLLILAGAGREVQGHHGAVRVRHLPLRGEL